MSFYQLGFKLLLIALIWGCQQRSTLEMSSNIVTLNPRPFKVSQVTTVDWKVGPERQQTVSRGINIVISLPQLKKNDLKYLLNERGVDSWFLQLHRRGESRTEALHRTMVPLSLTEGQVRTALFPIYYSASAISMRMAQSACPNFSHRYIIDEVVTSTQPSGVQTISLNAVNEAQVGGKVPKAEIRPSSINGGARLIGDYRVEIALFDSKTKRRKSNFVVMSDVVSVPNERIIDLRGCENFEMPDAPNKDLQEFRFGR